MSIGVAGILLSQAIQFSLLERDDEANAALIAGMALGGIAQLVLLGTIIAMAFQMSKGPRWGDGHANTRVIWRRYGESYVFNPTAAASAAAAPEFAPAMPGGAPETSQDPYRAPRS
jgi:hypothetical protein